MYAKEGPEPWQQSLHGLTQIFGEHKSHEKGPACEHKTSMKTTSRTWNDMKPLIPVPRRTMHSLFGVTSCTSTAFPDSRGTISWETASI